MSAIPPELRALVRKSVALLGRVIHRELGAKAYFRVEETRRKMKLLRDATPDRTCRVLRERLRMLEGLKRSERLEFARAYTLMLELMNACENAYRSHRLALDGSRKRSLTAPDSIIYVLTAHPTEARSPENIHVFHEIQLLLTQALLGGEVREALQHWLELAWKTTVVRPRKPRVRDEAEHIYSTLLRDETLGTLLDASRELAPVYVRSWVGGDKDGHPGVNERVFLESLQLSRRKILSYFRKRLSEVQDAARSAGSRDLELQCRGLQRNLNPLSRVGPGDGSRVRKIRSLFRALSKKYFHEIGAIHPSLKELRQLTRTFPAWVVPLEFRESSEMIIEALGRRGLAISKMLQALGGVSRGGDPRWYVRGLIISMTRDLRDVQAGAKLVSRALGGLRLPVVPLLETSAALDSSVKIAQAMLKDRSIRDAIQTHWGGYLEVMVGYSDSAKESGVLPSRLKIAQAMHALDRLSNRQGVTPLFFQGSGGSVDRGGGTIPEQTAWWPAGALRNYKVTLQGEMVERSLASPEITRGQLERIAESAGRWKERRTRVWRASPAVSAFATRISGNYRRKVHSPDFLDMVERATPYAHLGDIRIGSRPTRRAKTLSVESLRAIPWVLCWTQTRVLFPTWWGVGSSWNLASSVERHGLRSAYRSDPLFTTFVRALDFTLAKVELPVWRLYLERSGLPASEIERMWEEFTTEFTLSLECVRSVIGEKSHLSWRPWLRESIRLRAPMIHPLNLLQVLAIQQNDPELLRMTVTGISSGMMTTG